MTRPSFPPRERERQAAVDATHLLDTLPEKDFSDLVELAAYICGTPIAAMSLVSQDRQWFKAYKGLAVSETPRDVSFCAHGLLEPEVLMEVPDATKDERFRDNPLVTGLLGLRFYAGMPLVNEKGLALGALCVIDTQPTREMAR